MTSSSAEVGGASLVDLVVHGDECWEKTWHLGLVHVEDRVRQKACPLVPINDCQDLLVVPHEIIRFLLLLSELCWLRLVCILVHC